MVTKSKKTKLTPVKTNKRLLPQRWVFIAAILVLLGGLLAAYKYYYGAQELEVYHLGGTVSKSRGSANNVPVGGNKGCTYEAKVCPDGSSVGRTGPNCEFAPCPGGQPKWGNYNPGSNSSDPSKAPGGGPTNPSNPGGGGICTYEAKACPDGTWVGRVAPNCEFAPCPRPTPVVSPLPEAEQQKQACAVLNRALCGKPQPSAGTVYRVLPQGSLTSLCKQVQVLCNDPGSF